MFYQFFNLQSAKRDFNIFNLVNWGHTTSFDLLNWDLHGIVVNSTADSEPVFYKGREIKNVSLLMPFRYFFLKSF